MIRLHRVAVMSAVMALFVSFQLLAAEPPIVSEIDISPSDTPFTTEVVTLSVTASSPAGLPLTYQWDFGDNSPPASGATVTHTFAVEDLYIISVYVSDGVNLDPTTVIAFIESIQPPAATEPIGVNSGDVVLNPDNGLQISVVQDQGAFFEFFIDDTNLLPTSAAASRNTRNISTEWGDLGRAATGTRPRHKYENEGIFVAKTVVEDRASGSPLAKVRKTIVISDEAVGKPPKVTAPPPLNRRDITVTKMKGKFNFVNPSKTDLVTVSFEIDLPEGANLSVGREITFSLGNITETVAVDVKGKGKGTTFQQVKVKYPRLPKGQTLTGVGQIAKVQAKIAASDLNEEGFDTDGITARAKSPTPKIQIALLLDGVGYADQSEVQFKVTPKGDVGLISRAATGRQAVAP